MTRNARIHKEKANAPVTRNPKERRWHGLCGIRTDRFPLPLLSNGLQRTLMQSGPTNRPHPQT